MASVVDILKIIERYISLNKTVPYQLKVGGQITLHPITVADWLNVGDLTIFRYEKEKEPDLKIVQMSYLRFLALHYLQSIENGEQLFLKILSLVLKVESDKIRVCYDNEKRTKLALVVVDESENLVFKISEQEFEDIRRIILYQNLLDFNENFVSEDMKKVVADFLKINKSNTKDINLGDKIIYVYAKKNLSLEQINNMPYLFFNKVFQILYECEDYLPRKIIQASYKYDVAQNVEHPLREVKQSIYDMAICSMSEVSDKINKIM